MSAIFDMTLRIDLAPLLEAASAKTTRHERFIAARRNRNSLLFSLLAGNSACADTPNDPSRHGSGDRGKNARLSWDAIEHGRVERRQAKGPLDRAVTDLGPDATREDRFGGGPSR